VKGGGKGRRRKLAINRLRARLIRLMAEERPVAETVDRFFAQHEFPIVEQNRCTFAVRTEADAVFLRHRVVGLPGKLPLRRIPGTDVWYVLVEIPADSRVEYQFELCRGSSRERFNDPAYPRVARSPVGTPGVLHRRLLGAGLDTVRPGGPARRTGRVVGSEPGPAPGQPGHGLPASALPAHGPLSAADRARRR
jgi:hypothetical protein